MPIISTIGRRSLRVRALIAAIYLLLVAGAVTMVYPFLLMLAGSTKTDVDTPDARVIPPYLVDDAALYQKYTEALFNEQLLAMKTAYDSSASSFQVVDDSSPASPILVDLWREFLTSQDLPHYAYALGFVLAPQSRSSLPHRLRAFKAQLIEEFGGEIDRMNKVFHAKFANWNSFRVPNEDYLLRRNQPGLSAFHQRYQQFKAAQPIEARYYFIPENFFKIEFLKNRYGRAIEDYNRAHQTHYASWDDVHLDRRLPVGEGRTELEREDWLLFMRSLVNLVWIRADGGAAPAYRDFLRAKYQRIEVVNRNYQTRYQAFDEIPLVQEPPQRDLIRSDWESFVEGWKDPDTGQLYQLPAASLYVHSVEFQFRDWLQERFGEIAALNQHVGSHFTDWLAIRPPQQALHREAFAQQTGWLRWEFTRRNYLSVWDYVALHGRAIVNTTIYCVLAILTALIVNPLAAYGLSRYRPPSAYKLLLFLMLTMAFPPMVTQIPVFLMMREFHMLNTFWALILPGIANGYAIFLLKGFFDSLPQELYESAQIDGAGEFRIFWQITMSLSKPILAVIALNAFTQAYSNFMFALLICQDERMWTLMPWLYQLQQRSGQGVIFASLIIAAIPTFLVFALCQNVIMRGIVVPVEK